MSFEPKCKSSQEKRSRLITLEASDGRKITLNQYETLPSKLIQDAIEEDISDEDEEEGSICDGGGSDSTIIPLINVRSDTLENIVTFLKHYAIEPLNEIAPPLEGSTFEELIQQDWYRRFINDLPTKKELFELLNAASYMDISCLFNIACLKVSCDLVDKSADEIRQFLNLPALSKDEEAKAREDHPWMFED
jgi:S-phase kinase-associated protein 1